MRRAFTLIELMIVVAIIAIIAAIAIPSLLRSRIAANEVSANGALKQLTSHESTIRQIDGDGNGSKDYWTADVAGFYALEDASGNEMKLMDVQFARADDDALAIYTWATPAAGSGVPKSGYLYQAIDNDENGLTYNQDADNDGNSYTNTTKYGFVAYPATYAREGIMIFIVNEEGIIYSVDNGEDGATNKGEYTTLDGAGFAWPGTDPTTVAAGGGRFWGAAE